MILNVSSSGTYPVGWIILTEEIRGSNHGLVLDIESEDDFVEILYEVSTWPKVKVRALKVISYRPFLLEIWGNIIKNTDKPLLILLPSSAVGIEVIRCAIGLTCMMVLSDGTQSYSFEPTININTVIPSSTSVRREKISMMRRYDGLDSCCMELEKDVVN